MALNDIVLILCSGSFVRLMILMVPLPYHQSALNSLVYLLPV